MLAFSTLLLFWTAADLENKLLDFRTYFNNQRTLNGRANAESACVTTNRKSSLVSMATSLSIRISDTRGCVISEDSRSLRYPVNLGKTSN